MNNNETLKKLEEAVQSRLPDGLKASSGTVTKNNGQKDTYICIKSPEPINSSGNAAGLILYVDEALCDIHNDNVTIEDVAAELAAAFQTNYPVELSLVDTNAIVSKEFIMEHVICEVINREMNESVLEEVVYEEFLDLAIIFRVVIDQNQEGRRSYKLTKNLQEALGISKEELLAVAKNNTFLRQGISFTPLDEIIPENIIAELDTEADMEASRRIYALSNTKMGGNFGATSIIFEDELAKIAQKLGDFYILPSSVHEVVIMEARVVDEEEYGVELLKDMVADTNNTVVDKPDLLSYHVYRYCADTKEITIVA